VDFKTVRTPFSGGSGILVQGLVSPRAAYALGLACLAVIIAIGGYFYYVHGYAIIPLGIVGILTVYFYTTHLTRSPLLCAIAPGLGFGPLMVMGTYFALTGTYSLAAGLASVIPFLLVSNLLLLNQFPDVEADASVARRHLPIAIGRKWSAEVYTVLLVAAYAALIASVVARALPWLALLGLLTLPLGLLAIKGARRYHDQIEQLIPTMGRNVMLTLALPLLMAVGVILS
jgi:1,4-dihydroxy-2-naphthoate octaprenyltransferase